MPLALRLNKKSAKTIVLVGFILTSGAWLFSRAGESPGQLALVYHQSRWGEYGPEITRALASNPETLPLELEVVYGGVVPHHLPVTIPRLVNFYRRLARHQTVKNFIILGPDHVNAGRGPITVSAASFFSDTNELLPLANLAEALVAAKLAVIDESPFELEHSIGAQTLVISRLFPDARVTPIIFRSDASPEQALNLGEKLAHYLDNETVLIASVDFSHYLATSQARPIDQLSGQILEQLNLADLSLIKADSPAALTTWLSAMRAKGALASAGLEVLNTNDLMQNSDYTTGYVFGYWGRALD